jgi:hypothetical protein
MEGATIASTLRGVAIAAIYSRDAISLGWSKGKSLDFFTPKDKDGIDIFAGKMPSSSQKPNVASPQFEVCRLMRRIA